jgi:hypothetical protein
MLDASEDVAALHRLARAAADLARGLARAAAAVAAVQDMRNLAPAPAVRSLDLDGLFELYESASRHCSRFAPQFGQDLGGMPPRPLTAPAQGTPCPGRTSRKTAMGPGAFVARGARAERPP